MAFIQVSFMSKTLMRTVPAAGYSAGRQIYLWAAGARGKTV